MAGVIVPVAKALYLCEEVDVEGGMTNLYALFSAIRPRHYPHRHESFVCFAQLVGGLGHVPCHVDIRRAETGQLVYCTNILPLHFPDRDTLLQVRVNIEGCEFEAPGIYLVELYCDNTWVADTVIRLREGRA
jgi:hypothetical protein